MTTPFFPRLRVSYRVTLTRKGQFAVPAAVWRRLGWQPGDRLELDLTGDGFAVRRPDPAPSQPNRMRRKSRGSKEVARP